MHDTFASRLTARREQAGLTRYALAKRTGLSQTALASLEGGADPHLSTVHLLATALDCRACDLVGTQAPEKKSREKPGAAVDSTTAVS